MTRVPLLLPALLCASLLTSCASKDAVSVSGSIDTVQLTVQQGPLVTSVSGGFSVFLELGERASEGTDITFAAFSLVRADTGAALPSLERLSAVSSQTLPVHLEPGDQATVPYQLGDQTQPSAPVVPLEASKEAFEEICGAGQLRIVGTLQDSAQGNRTMPIASAAFTPSGCGR